MYIEHVFLCCTLLSAILVIQHFPQLIIAAGSPVQLLPGFQGPLPFQLETGYIGVGESEDVQLFYYFIKSERSPKSDPVILWLTGGPGCSALSGLIYEIGPITFEAVENDGSLPKMVLRPHSWTKAANIIFLDFPVGTGFSYARNPAALHSIDVQACNQVYEFLRKWFVEYQEFISNPFYVGGDSYSGLIVPLITQFIDTGNDLGSQPHINIKGYLLGNPATSPDAGNYKVPFAHGMGLISDELFESLKRSCEGKYYNVNPSNEECLMYLETFNQMLVGINYPHILEPLCGFASPRFDPRRSLAEKFQERSNIVGELPALTCRTDWYKFIYQWANNDQVRNALHVQKGSTEQWNRCSHDLSYTITIGDSIPYHVNLSVKGFRSLIYSGDHDFNIPFQSTQAWIRSLNYPIIDDWRRWIVEGQVAGYTRAYSNQMTFATVKGGGHTAPEYKPVECLAMLKRWLSHEAL